MKFLLILLFIVPAYGQRVYVVTDSVRTVVAKQIRLVPDPKDAEIFLEYKILLRGMSDATAGGLVVGTYERGEMTAYRLQDGERTVMWSDTAYGAPWKVPQVLAKRFRVALKKSSK